MQQAYAQEEEMAMASERRGRSKRKTKLRMRKNGLILLSGLKALAQMPNRTIRGPLYDSFNWITELCYRAAINVVDHHYLFSWEDLRHLYPKLPPSKKRGSYRSVHVGPYIRGEFVRYCPAPSPGTDGDEDMGCVQRNTTFMYIHGGGFCMGDVTTYRRWGLKMSKLLGGIQFFFVDYGLSPENKFPTALQQCWKTYLWLISKQGANIPPERLIIGGDSAGGNLTLSLLFLIRQARLEKHKRDLIREGRYPDLTVAPAGSDDERDSITESWFKHEEKRHGSHIQQVLGAELPKFYCTRKDLPEEEEFAVGSEEVSRRREYRRKMNDDVRAGWRQRLIADKHFMRLHAVPFDLDEFEKELFPPLPLCAMLLSPWVDLSEHSSAFQFRNYPKPATYRPYHIGLRFVHAYLGLQPSDRPFTIWKNRELLDDLSSGLRAHSREIKALREKDKARNRGIRIRAQMEYYKKLTYEELCVRQAHMIEEKMKERIKRKRRKSIDMGCMKNGRNGIGSCCRAKHKEKCEGFSEETLDSCDRKHEKKKIKQASIYSPYVSPIYGDLLGLPPLLVTGGDEEPLWEDIQRLVQKGRRQGLEVELIVGRQMNHDFQLFFDIVAHPEVARFLERAKAWFHLQLEIIGELEELQHLKQRDERIKSQQVDEGASRSSTTN